MKPLIRQSRHRQGQSGLGLIEIMVALAISAVLLTGVIQIFLSSKMSYRVAEANSRVQEGGRYAVEMLTDDLRMAGYTGCFRGGALENTLAPANDFRWNIGTPIEGHDWTGAGWNPALPALIAGEVLNGTDVIVMRGMARDGAIANRTGNSNVISVDDPAPMTIATGDILMVSDCNQSAPFPAALFRVNGTAAGGGRITINHNALSSSYGAASEVGHLQTSVYYIANGASGNPSLFRRVLVNTGGAVQMSQPQELVDNVENLQLLYGVDADGDGVANRYVRAHETAAGMADVVSIRASLLLRTENNIASSAQTYAYNGANVAATDLRVRRVFTSTVKVRNRGVL
jgi:type IV pilus assembly protein PilW